MILRQPSRLVALLGLALVAAACTGSGSAGTVPPVGSIAPSAAPAVSPGPSGATTYPPDCPTSQPAALAASETRTVTIATAKGSIAIAIKGSLSPIATGNFVALAKCGYYDGVIFHRLVPGFVIQGGDGQFGRQPNVYPDLVGSGGPPYTIKDEPVTAKYVRGTLAMARTSQPNSVNSQFFIVLSDAAQPALAQANTYQIIGSVTTGMDVVDTIAAMPNSGQPNNAATDPVAMTKVTVTNP
jgi:cyclophilin family peptidyl-prolyl cis-trans isomerase